VWNVYLAQTTNDGTSFQQSLVSNTPNHVGVVCTQGIACGSGTRNLLDLFKVAIDPNNGRAAVIYTDDTITNDLNAQFIGAGHRTHWCVTIWEPLRWSHKLRKPLTMLFESLEICCNQRTSACWDYRRVLQAEVCL
jgi:hypothetical protein